MSNDYGGETPLSYSKYLRIPDLLGLQGNLSDSTHQDELLFITVHQTDELWFKQILHELDAAILDMAEDQAAAAIRDLKRIVEVEKLLVSQVHLLETMTPRTFLPFRDAFDTTSGFQSQQFREIEFSSGLKDVEILAHYRHDAVAYARLKARYDGPVLGDGFYALLSRRGFDAPTEQGILDPEERRKLYGRRTRAVLEILTHFKDRSEEFQLVEALIEYDEYFGLWRSHSNKMIERMAGPPRDPAGSESAGRFGATLNKNFFPELWEARTHLQTRHDAEKCPFAGR